MLLEPKGFHPYYPVADNSGRVLSNLVRFQGIGTRNDEEDIRVRSPRRGMPKDGRPDENPAHKQQLIDMAEAWEMLAKARAKQLQQNGTSLASTRPPFGSV
jgi:hypothetical protein